MLLKIHASFHQDGKTINKANEEKGEVSLDVRMWCYYEELKEKRENIWIEDYGASYEELKHTFMTTTVLVVPEGLVEMVVGVASGSGSMSSPTCGFMPEPCRSGLQTEPTRPCMTWFQIEPLPFEGGICNIFCRNNGYKLVIGHFQQK